jgi:hypothetical protein
VDVDQHVQAPFIVERNVVVNPPSGPVPTLNVNDGRKVFQPFNTRVVEPGSIQSSLNFTVPTGKRFVIEFASLELSVPNGNTAACAVFGGLNPTAFTAEVQHQLVLTAQGPDGERAGQSILHAAQPIKMYVDHSTEAGVVDIQVLCTFAQDAGSTIFRASFSGYLVPIP